MVESKNIQNYRQLSHWSLKKSLRHTTLSLRSAAYSIVGLKNQALEKSRVHFLYLHHVFIDEEKSFRELLEWLNDNGHVFVSYTTAVDLLTSGPIDKPYVCFSFDDGLKSCLWAGKILSEYGISACYFLNNWIIDTHDSALISEYCRNYLRLPPLEFLTWNDIGALQSGGHEIGGHTEHHINMAIEDSEKLRAEVFDNRDVLERHCGSVRHFAWPYGQSQYFSELARDIVCQAGYRSCASAVRGCHIEPKHDQTFYIKREHCVAAWPIEHIAYFLSRSSLNANVDAISACVEAC